MSSYKQPHIRLLNAKPPTLIFSQLLLWIKSKTNYRSSSCIHGGTSCRELAYLGTSCIMTIAAGIYSLVTKSSSAWYSHQNRRTQYTWQWGPGKELKGPSTGSSPGLFAHWSSTATHLNTASPAMHQAAVTKGIYADWMGHLWMILHDTTGTLTGKCDGNKSASCLHFCI